MKELGRIVDIEGSYAIVSVKRSEACSKCGACEMGTTDKETRLKIQNDLKGTVGDMVEIELPAQQFLKASAILYLIPLVALLIGVFSGYAIGNNLGINGELTGAILGIILTAVTYLVIKMMDPVFRKTNKFLPQMVGIVSSKKKGDRKNGK
ncbi:MAG: SoxR reducing system RseC family protein [Xylanivirga thermophila]|uniref:SoxR reducing system RseC family protein n=1 Tax=Xylanivirga thermophila TaxID=2496273 RepID=UPI0013EBBCC9|nr:SoxR reducing system RseC family protein [Xylanivirga thermophila]